MLENCDSLRFSETAMCLGCPASRMRVVRRAKLRYIGNCRKYGTQNQHFVSLIWLKTLQLVLHADRIARGMNESVEARGPATLHHDPHPLLFPSLFTAQSPAPAKSDKHLQVVLRARAERTKDLKPNIFFGSKESSLQQGGMESSPTIHFWAQGDTLATAVMKCFFLLDKAPGFFCPTSLPKRSCDEKGATSPTSPDHETDSPF